MALQLFLQNSRFETFLRNINNVKKSTLDGFPRGLKLVFYGGGDYFTSAKAVIHLTLPALPFSLTEDIKRAGIDGLKNYKLFLQRI